jgi:hypothetical protein
MEFLDTTLSEHAQTIKDAFELLQAENTSLRAELQALRETRIKQNPHSRSPNAGTFNFFGLPREIRDAIYEMCVVPGVIFIKRPDQFPHLPDLDMRNSHRRKQTKAQSQLLSVNKKLRYEALEVFVSMNQFVISAPTGKDWEVYTDPIEPRIPGHQDDSSLLKGYLRSVSISLNSFETTPNEIARNRVNMAANAVDYVDNPDDADTDFSHSRGAAVRYREITVQLTIRFGITLIRLFEFPGQLRRIQINLESTFCPLGCHRLVKALFDSSRERLARLFAKRPNNDLLESLDFLGTVSDEERDAIRLAFPSFIRDKITFHGTFNRQCGVWNSVSHVHTPKTSAGDGDSDARRWT